MNSSGVSADSGVSWQAMAVSPGLNHQVKNPQGESGLDTDARNARKRFNLHVSGRSILNLRSDINMSEGNERAKFISVKCGDCGNDQVSFSKPASTVACQVCGATLIKCKGGKGEVLGEILGEVE